MDELTEGGVGTSTWTTTCGELILLELELMLLLLSLTMFGQRKVPCGLQILKPLFNLCNLAAFASAAVVFSVSVVAAFWPLI